MDAKRKRGHGAGGRDRRKQDTAPLPKKKKIDNSCSRKTNPPEFVGRVTRSQTKKASFCRSSKDRGVPVSEKTSEGTSLEGGLNVLAGLGLGKKAQAEWTNGKREIGHSDKRSPRTAAPAARGKLPAKVCTSLQSPGSEIDYEPLGSSGRAGESTIDCESLVFPWERAAREGAPVDVSCADRNLTSSRFAIGDGAEKGAGTEKAVPLLRRSARLRSSAGGAVECEVLHKRQASSPKPSPPLKSFPCKGKIDSKRGDFEEKGKKSSVVGEAGLEGGFPEGKGGVNSGKSALVVEPPPKAVTAKLKTYEKKKNSKDDSLVRSVILKPKFSGKRWGLQPLGLLFPLRNNTPGEAHGDRKTSKSPTQAPLKHRKEKERGNKEGGVGTSVEKRGASSSQAVVESGVPSADAAEELGMNLMVLDSIVYALDGLRPECDILTQRANAMAILGTMSDTQGRKALQAANLVKNGILRRFASVLGGGDPVLVLSCAYVILALAQPKADLVLFASKEVLVVVKFLLRQNVDCVTAEGELVPLVRSDSEARAKPADRVLDGPTKSLLKVMHGNALGALIPDDEIGCPCSIALAALSMAVDGNLDSPVMEDLKEAMAAYGVVDGLCNLMVDCWNLCPLEPDSSLPEDRVEDISRALWKVQYCMDVLTCMTNSIGPCQQHLIKKKVPDCKESAKLILFPAFLASRFSAIRSKFPELVRSNRCNALQGVLGLLMNLGHGDVETAEMLCKYGVMEGCGELLVMCCLLEGQTEQHTDASKSCAPEVENLNEASSIADCGSNIKLSEFKSAVDKHGSSLVCILGLLINLCEKSERNSQALVSMKLPTWMPGGAVAGGMLELLSLLVRALESVGVTPAPGKEKLESDVLTLTCAAMLLGYVIQNDSGLRESVAKFFPSGNLESIVGSIELLLSWNEGGSSPVTGCDRGALERIIRTISAKD